MNILVPCTGNSARSILLEILLNDLGKGRISAFSAGSRPSGRVHPHSLTLFRERGYDAAGLRSKSWDEFASEEVPKMDAVITVCGSTAGEACPIWPGAPVRVHWGIEGPAAEPEERWPDAFATAWSALHARTKALIALPLETLSARALKRALDRMGNFS